MLGRLRFMKVNQHKRFDYRPMYYNERKEQLMKQVEQNKHAKSSTSSERELIMREQFARNKRIDSYQNQSFKSTIRLVIILAIILGLIYFLFQGMDDMVEVYKTSTK